MAMPRWSAWTGVSGRTSRPSINICPEVRATTPAMTLVRVDLPAPFSPTSVWISPGRSAKSMSSMAGTPAYFFVAFRSSTIAPVMAAVSAPTRRRQFHNPSTALGQHKQGALALHRGDNAVVLAVNAAVQRILDRAIAREAHHEAVGTRRCPRLMDAAHLEVSALQRLQEGIAGGERRRDPISRIDLLHHARAIGFLAKHEFDELSAAGEGGEPVPAVRCGRQPGRIARQSADDRRVPVCLRHKQPRDAPSSRTPRHPSRPQTAPKA